MKIVIRNLRGLWIWRILDQGGNVVLSGDGANRRECQLQAQVELLQYLGMD